MSTNIRNTTVVSFGKVTKQLYPAEYLTINYDYKTISDCLHSLNTKTELVIMLPPLFDFGDEHILEDMVELLGTHQESKIFYTDFLIKKKDSKIAQFVPTITPEVIANNFIIDVPILFYAINDNLEELLKDKENFCWEILKTITSNGILSYHLPRFFFVKNDSTS